MPEITATEFKARCLELMDRVRERGETYVITKRNRPVAKLSAVDAAPEKGSVLGCLSGELEIVGDVAPAGDARHAWAESLREWDELNAVATRSRARKANRRK